MFKFWYQVFEYLSFLSVDTKIFVTECCNLTLFQIFSQSLSQRYTIRSIRMQSYGNLYTT